MIASIDRQDPEQAHFTPSLNHIIKELKREENSLFNCLHSIVHDTSFVQQIEELYTELPIYANLRCGKWYTPGPHGTCYFKSTDGHFGEWNFSATRLNLHLAVTASQKGGCIIVDATRRGKTFPVTSSQALNLNQQLCSYANMDVPCERIPTEASVQDALSKTIPIWAAVLNAAVLVHRERSSQQDQGTSS